jgi:hypothetical protein
VDAKGRTFDGTRGDYQLLAKEHVLGDQFGAGAGQIGDEAARDAGRTPRVTDRPHRPSREIGDGRRKPGAEDAEHGAIPADARAIIKACSAATPERSCGGGGQ